LLYDVIVIGVGGMGSAVVYHLARRGAKVLGLERYSIPHEMGSSHGMTRIIRLAYSEHPNYVPLLRRAYALWRDLEREAGEQLLFVTGGIDAGKPESEVLKGSLESCREHDLAHEVLDASALRERFPGYRLATDMMAVVQPDAGFLLPERCIVSHVAAARSLGAEIHAGEAIVRWHADDAEVVVHAERSTYRAKKLVISAGAWAGKLVAELAPLAVPERQVLLWTAPLTFEHFRMGAFPIFNMEAPEGRFYGFPAYGVPGFKIGRYHHRRERIDPDTMRRECTPEDEAVLRQAIRRYFPDADGPTLAMKACIFTNTPDEHFIIDRHPSHPCVYIVSACSGHGFKFCSVIGEITADLALAGGTAHDIRMFRLSRFESTERHRLPHL
jgi:sarcosine oxidase